MISYVHKIKSITKTKQNSSAHQTPMRVFLTPKSLENRNFSPIFMGAPLYPKIVCNRLYFLYVEIPAPFPDTLQFKCCGNSEKLSIPTYHLLMCKHHIMTLYGITSCSYSEPICMNFTKGPL